MHCILYSTQGCNTDPGYVRIDYRAALATSVNPSETLRIFARRMHHLNLYFINCCWKEVYLYDVVGPWLNAHVDFSL